MMFLFKLLTILACALSAFAAVHFICAALGKKVREGATARVQRVIELADISGVTIPDMFMPVLGFFWFAVHPCLEFLHRRRCRAADRQLPDALSLMGSSLKAGLSLVQALESASANLPPPLGDEFARVVAQLKLGKGVEEALAHLEERLPTDDISVLVMSVESLRRAGGNLIETFSLLASTIEGRRKVEERVRVLTAQGVAQGIMLLAMPWGLGLALHVLSPDYLEPLISTRLGWFMIAIGILLEAAGALWLRKIVMIKV